MVIDMLAAKNLFSRCAACRPRGAYGLRSVATAAQVQVERPQEELDDAGVRMVLETLKTEAGEKAMDSAMQPWSGSVGQRTVNKVLEQVKDGNTALQFFNWASKQDAFSKHSFHSYRLLLQRLTSCGLRTEVRCVLQEMHEAGYYLKKTEYASMSTELLKENHAEEVIGIVQDMTVNKNFNPWVANQLIRATYEMKKPDVSGRILKIICQAAVPKQDDASDNNTWTVQSLLKKENDYSMVIDLLCREGLVEQACSVFDMMSKAGHEATIFIYARLADGFVKASKLSEASALLDVMVEQGLIPQAIIYNQLIDGLCKAGKMKEAFELSATMVENGCSCTGYTYNSLLNGLCLQGKTGEAREFMRKMADVGCPPDVVTYTVLISRLRKDGNFKAAVEVFDEMVSKGCVPDKASYVPLLTDLCKFGCVQLVLAVLDKHKSYLNLGSYFYNLLIRTLAKHGRVEDAKRVFRIMPSPELIHFNSYMSALCQRRLISEAFEVYEQIQKKGLVPDTYTYTILIGGLCDVGRMDEALSLKDTMIQNNFMPDSVTRGILRAGLLKAGRLAEAEHFKDQTPAPAATAAKLSH